MGPLRRRAGRPPLGLRLRGIFSAHVTQVVLILLFLAATGLYGALRGGQYEAFVAEYGSPGDLAARALGLGIAAITITGERELVESDILAAAQISPRNSLLFLDVAAVRDRLKQIPPRSGCQRPQALSRPPAHRNHRTPALRSVAEGRRRRSRLGRRNGARRGA